MKHHLVDLIQVCSNYTHWANNGPASGVTCFMLPTGFNLSPNVKSCYTQITSLEKKPPALGKRWLPAAPRPLAPETPRYQKPTLPQSPPQNKCRLDIAKNICESENDKEVLLSVVYLLDIKKNLEIHKTKNN